MSHQVPSDDPLDGELPRVLIVDDNTAITRGLARLFRDAGYHPVVFNDGLSAIDFANERGREGSKQTGLVAAIIDIHLPDINGLILSRQMRDALGVDLPIIVLSGDASMEVLNTLPHVGATYFFHKPVNGSVLLERIRELTA